MVSVAGGMPTADSAKKMQYSLRPIRILIKTMDMKRIMNLLSVGLVASLGYAQHPASLKITNNHSDQRHEVVEVPMDRVRKALGVTRDTDIIVTNSIGQQIASQRSYDGKLLVDVSVRPHSTTTYTLSIGKPQPPKPFVYGRLFPERKDDLAWENDRGAYRAYGPALQKSGEQAFGIDVWVKNTPDLVVENRYATNNSGWELAQKLKSEGHKAEADSVYLATSFHLDHGRGYDPYQVGPTLGCGAPALMVRDSLVMPYCFTDYKILENGPLRFTVEFTFEPKTVNGNKRVVEHRRISLDKGSNFNRATVRYDGLKRPTDVAAGVVIHEAPNNHVVIGKDHVQYNDPTDKLMVNNSEVYVAALFPDSDVTTTMLPMRKPTAGAVGHAVGVRRAMTEGQPFTYYFGAAWSRYDVRTQREWQLRIDETLFNLRHPLEISF